MKRSVSALALLALAGCATGPDYKRPELDIPDAWRTETTNTEGVAAPSGADFYRDPVLAGLIEATLAGNKDLAISAARVEEALANYRIQRAALFPALNASADFTTAQAGNIPPVPGASSDQYNLFGLLSYEVDLWGRVRRQREAAFAQALATEEGRRALQIGLVAQVAATYFNLRALDRQLEIAKDTLASRSNAWELTRIKFDEGNGIVSELDVAQAMTQVASARSAMANIERQVAITEHALNQLAGRNPGAVPRGLPLSEQWRPEEWPVDAPSALLLRRPDLRAAEQQLIAANANIGVARAAYFPALSLTGAFGLQSEALGELFDTGLSEAWSFKPSVTAPIFNAGRVRSGVRAAEARRSAALAEYERAIQGAFREVSDALVSIARLREQLAADEAVVTAERRRLELSTLRYEGGVASFSDVLDAQRFLFSAELTEVQTRAALLNATVQLYQAMGGGWAEDPKP